ncbi:hypothetical protein OCU04_006595 [Sclerotinia nivalis]|uniref:2EXR domain-containing protein n=1 Tax=Sclerotinia nivalis TaxID=352851 RepID=A0A9X0DKN5_9HELO|nr:hypothetical protein OCU04_006595 [Sclerotinia nivalis]
MTSATQAGSKALTEFTLFSRLPFELQSRIFQEAHPGPVVIFIGTHLLTHEREIAACAPRYPELLPLLLACKESNAEVFRKFQKIETTLPPSFLFRQFDRALSYTYIRPTVDTLLLGTHDLLQLYRYGGRMNLENITCLALGDANFTMMRDTKKSYQMVIQAELYTLISTHCPALTKLWVFIGIHPSGWAVPSVKSAGRIMDVSDGLTDLDFHFRPHLERLDRQTCHSQYFPTSRNTLNKIKNLNDGVNQLLRNFDRFLNPREDDLWEMPRDATLKYWKNLRPTPGLLCFFRDDPQLYRGSCYQCFAPILVVPILDGRVACRLDGTPLHKYTGLAQIFEGAPW